MLNLPVKTRETTDFEVKVTDTVLGITLSVTSDIKL